MICTNCGHNDSKKMSTPQQRKAYFGLAVNKMADYYGYEKNIMHKALAGAFFGFVDVRIGDVVLKVPETTTGRTTKEMSDFFNWIQKTGAEVGVDIPSPDQGAPAGYK